VFVSFRFSDFECGCFLVLSLSSLAPFLFVFFLVVLLFRWHRMHEMQTVVVNDPGVSLSVCLAAFAVQIWLNGSCLSGDSWETQETLY